MKQECFLSPLFYSIVPEVLSMTVREEREIKGTQIGKKEFKLSLFSHDRTLKFLEENP